MACLPTEGRSADRQAWLLCEKKSRNPPNPLIKWELSQFRIGALFADRQARCKRLEARSKSNRAVRFLCSLAPCLPTGRLCARIRRGGPSILRDRYGEIQQGSDFIPLPQSILAAGRFSVPGCLVRSSPSVFRYCSANALSAATTAGFWGAKSNVSPGSVDRS